MSDERFAGDATLLARLPAESAFIALTSSGPAGERAMRLVVDRPIDCARLVHLAVRERAVAAVSEQLARTPIRGPLPADLANLQRLAMVAEFQLSSLHDRLVKLLTLYVAHDIDVLLLKDVVHTGVIETYLMDHLRGAGTASLRLAAIVDKPLDRKTNVSVDFSLFSTESDGLFAGYGMAHEGLYAHLPEIHEVVSEQ